MKNRYNGKLVVRSLLFTAGHNDRYIQKAFATKSDAIVLDLEDAVPHNRKEEARCKIKNVLETEVEDNRPLFVRINPLESGHTLKDLDVVAHKNLDGFVYPMVRTEDDIKVFDAQLTLKEKLLGLDRNHFKIIALIETPEAVMNVYSIAKASERIVGLLFGSEDFLAEIQGLHGKDGRSILVPRHLVSMAAKSANILALDTPYVNIGDVEGLKVHIKQAKELGFDGMLAMSPKELEIINEYYTPSIAEINDAKEMVRLADDAVKENKGIAVYNGRFVSPPTLSYARKLLDRFMAIEDFEMFNKK
jgi:citrate lyase subunit beta / citryl-CoA lyase